jgi:hypothetical protein
MVASSPHVLATQDDVSSEGNVDRADTNARIQDVARRARSIFDDDAAAWGLSPRAALALATFPVVVAVLVAAAHLVHPIYRFLTAEDSVLEWLQVACLVGTALFLGLIARTLVGRREWLWAGLFAAGAVVVVFVVGEEVSWGQRLLGIETPEDIEAINNQGEINVHNVVGVLMSLNFATMIGAGLAVALPLAVATAREFGWSVHRLAYRVVPPLALVTAFAIPFAYRFARFIRSRGTSGSFAEMVEFSLYFGLLMFAFLLRRRIANEGQRARA